MDYNHHSHVIIVYPSYEVAVLAFDQLIIAGFSPEKFLIVGKEMIQHHGHVDALQTDQTARQVFIQSLISSRNVLKTGCRIGSIVGGAIGSLLGLSVLSLPGVDGIILLSKIVFILPISFFCTVSGGVLGTIAGWKFNQSQIRMWRQKIAQGSYLLIVNGSTDETTRAKRCLNSLRKEKLFSKH